jgi:hypothetical protein
MNRKGAKDAKVFLGNKKRKVLNFFFPSFLFSPKKPSRPLRLCGSPSLSFPKKPSRPLRLCGSFVLLYINIIELGKEGFYV